ncbi:unnamed protein product, partial [Mesorhabditis spiculigera]
MPKAGGEPIRLLFHYFDVDFEDVRLKLTDDYKKDAPFGQLPYLEVDGGKTTLCQTSAILRYIAKSFKPGFAGKTRVDAAKCDMVIDTIWDMFAQALAERFAPTPEIAAQKKEEWDRARPQKLAVFQKMLRKNGGKVMVGDELTYADLVLIYFLYRLQDADAEVLAEFSLLNEYYNKILHQRPVWKYVQKAWKLDQ